MSLTDEDTQSSKGERLCGKMEAVDSLSCMAELVGGWMHQSHATTVLLHTNTSHLEAISGLYWHWIGKRRQQTGKQATDQ